MNADFPELTDYLISLDFPVQHRQANCADHEERSPRTPQGRLNQKNLPDDVVIEIGDTNSARDALESAKQTCRYVLHQRSEADDVSPTSLEDEIDELTKH